MQFVRKQGKKVHTCNQDSEEQALVHNQRHLHILHQPQQTGGQAVGRKQKLNVLQDVVRLFSGIRTLFWLQILNAGLKVHIDKKMFFLKLKFTNISQFISMMKAIVFYLDKQHICF